MTGPLPIPGFELSLQEGILSLRGCNLTAEAVASAWEELDRRPLAAEGIREVRICVPEGIPFDTAGAALVARLQQRCAVAGIAFPTPQAPAHFLALLAALESGAGGLRPRRGAGPGASLWQRFLADFVSSSP